MLPRTYSHLSKQQRGAIGEHLASAAFLLQGFEVYKSAVDDRGIDLIVRRPGGNYYRVQVKTVGQSAAAPQPKAQPFIKKDSFHIDDDFLFVAVRLREDSEAELFVARGSAWNKPIECIRFNDKGGDAGPYYEFNLGRQYDGFLTQFAFSTYVPQLQ